MNQKQLVCHCNHVSAPEIKKCLRAGAITTSEIQKFTTAGTGCGRCIRAIDSILEKHLKQGIKDPQLKIRFL